MPASPAPAPGEGVELTGPGRSFVFVRLPRDRGELTDTRSEKCEDNWGQLTSYLEFILEYG